MKPIGLATTLFAVVLFCGTSAIGASENRAPLSPVHKHLLTCSKAPCVLPNVLISSNEAADTIMAVDPTKDSWLLATSEGGCTYGSIDGGSQWYESTQGICYAETLAYGEKAAYEAGPGYYSEIYVTSTSDNGQTWSTAVLAVQPLFENGAVYTPWIAVDNNPKSPFSNSVYIATTQRGYEGTNSEMAVSRSRDGGNTWELAPVDSIQTLPELDYYSRVTVGGDGTVFATWQRCSETGKFGNCAGTKADMMFSESGDGGVTWAKPTHVASVTLVPDTCNCAFFGNLPHTDAAVGNAPVVAVDNSGGTYSGYVYIVVYNWTGKQMQVEVISSQDGGSTWGTPVLVASAYKHDQFLPTVSVSSTGVLGVTWLDRRNDRRNVFYQPFAALSSDGGQTFGNNYRLAKPLSNPYWGAPGDYTGNGWAGKRLYYTWPDTRNSITQDFIGGLLTE